MDHHHTPTKTIAAHGGPSAASPARRPLLSGLRSPSVRRRPPSPSAPAPLVPAAPPPPAPSPPSEATVRTVMRLQDSVAGAVRRRLQRPPVYAAPQLPPLETSANPAGTHQLHNFWDHVGRPRKRGGGSARPGPLTEEHRRKLLFAVTSLEARLGAAAHPPSDVLSHLLRCCSEGDREMRRRCLRLLRQVIFLHPPHGGLKRKLYGDMLTGAAEQEGSPLWSAVQRCLSISPAVAAPAAREDHLLDTELLDLLVCLLEEDVRFWWRRNRLLSPATQLRDAPERWPLLVGALWPQQQPGASVAATRRLWRWLVEAHGRGAVDMVTRRLLLRLTTVAAEITRIRSQRGLLDITADMQTLADDLARAVQEQHLEGDSLEDLITSLRPAWLAARLAADRLHRRHGRRRLTGPLTLAVVNTLYLSEKENSTPPPVKESSAGPVTVNGAPAALPAVQKRTLLSPASSPAKRRRPNTRGAAEPDPGPAGSAAAAVSREYSALLFHLLSSHLLHTGLTEVRVRMTGRLLREAVGAAAHPSSPSAAAPAQAAAVSQEELVTYRRELEWIQDRLWRRGPAGQLDGQYELYMRTVTKL